MAPDGSLAFTEPQDRGAAEALPAATLSAAIAATTTAVSMRLRMSLPLAPPAATADGSDRRCADATRFKTVGQRLRRLEIAAGAPKYQGRSNIWSTNVAMREAERKLAEQAELAYRNTVRDWQATQTKRAKAAATVEAGASVTPGHASNRPSKGKAARQTTSP